MKGTKKDRMLISDSLSLSFVRVITLLIGVVSTSLLSHRLDLTTYGIYSQGNLLITMLTSVSILGFADGTNYFFNKFEDRAQKQRYINTMFGLQLVIGTVLAACVLIFQKVICAFFGSDGIKPYLIYLCFRPLLSNYTSMLQNMYVSVGKSKLVAVRTALVCMIRFAAICLCVFWTKDIGTVFLLMLLMDIGNVLYFIIAFSVKEHRINCFQIDRMLVKEIFAFCIPVAVFVLTSALCRELDKWVVARMGGTEELAIYTNAALPLPLEIISAAVMTVSIPILTRLYHKKALNSATKLIAGYLKIGYTTTVVFGIACLLLSRELITFLYGEKFLPGMGVFRLYLIVDIIKFANMSILMSISGRTKELMKVSVCVLIANLALNITGYWLFGIIGPAIATVLVSVFNISYLLLRGAKVLQCKCRNFFELRHLALFAGQLVACAAVTLLLKMLLNRADMAAFFVIAICGIVFCGAMLILNLKEMKITFFGINNLEETGNG